MIIGDDKENATRHKKMSRSILKAQNEQEYKVSISILVKPKTLKD